MAGWIRKPIVTLAAGFLLGVTGVALALSETESRLGIESSSTMEHDPAPTVTVTAEPRLDSTNQSSVEFPQSCRDALDFGQSIHDLVGPIAETMGQQKEILNNAKLSLIGAEYVQMSRVEKEQRDLESTLVGNYSRLAHARTNFDNALEKCNNEIGD